MVQHVQSLPVTFDLRGDVFILQDHALSSTLTPFCNCKKKNKILPTLFTQILKYSFDNLYSYLLHKDKISQNLAMMFGAFGTRGDAFSTSGDSCVFTRATISKDKQSVPNPEGMFAETINMFMLNCKRNYAVWLGVRTGCSDGTFYLILSFTLCRKLSNWRVQLLFLNWIIYYLCVVPVCF